MTHPKTFNNVLDQKHVVSVGSVDNAKSRAMEYFKDELKDKRPVTVTELFREGFRGETVVILTATTGTIFLYIIAAA